MIVTVTDMFDGVTPETSPVTITVIEGSATTGGGGGGAVDSVNGHVGVVVLDADDLADGTTNHVFTATDDTKLAGIATGATANDTDANLKARANHTGSQAIATVTGLQTALDGKETVGAAAAAQAASQPLDGDLTTIAALDSTTAGALTTDGAGWIRKTYAQLKTALSLVKADVGLGSVDNTADTAKPVSTAQQTALDLKANLASPALTGNPTAPTPSAADNDTSIATTAFVQGELTAKAPLASPTFTGNPVAPTASPGDNDTSIATTAFVTAAVAAGGGGSGWPMGYVLISAFSDPPDSVPVGTFIRGATATFMAYQQSNGTQNEEAIWANIPLGPGTYTFKMSHSAGANRGIATVTVDDGAGSYSAFTTVDEYNATTVDGVTTVTGLVISGAATLRSVKVKAATKNASSSAYYLVFHSMLFKRTA